MRDLATAAAAAVTPRSDSRRASTAKLQQQQQQQQQQQLTLFNDELIISVLRFVPPRDVLRLALVCRRWRRITGDPFLWRCLCAHRFRIHSLVKYSGSWKRAFFGRMRAMLLRFNLLGEDEPVVLRVDATQTVQRIKYQLYTQHKAPTPDSCVLMLDARVLPDSATLFDCGVFETCTVHVTRRFHACGLRKMMAAPANMYSQLNISSVSPAAGGIDAGVDAAIEVHFYDTQYERIYHMSRVLEVVHAETGAHVPGSVEFDHAEQSVVFVPSGRLAHGTRYVAQVFSEAFHLEPLDDDGLPHPRYSWSFQTERAPHERDQCSVM